MQRTIVLSCVAAAALYFTKRYFGGRECKCTARLDGKVIIVTGANSGIGKQLALLLAERGAHLVLACRDVRAGADTCAWIIKKTGNTSLISLYLDLNSFASIRNFVKYFKGLGYPLYALVNNAGVFYHPQAETEDGFDVTFQTNYLGPFLLTYLLLDCLKESQHSRIVNVTSAAHKIPKDLDIFDRSEKQEYNFMEEYGKSKLCMVLFTHQLASVLKGTSVTVNSVDPGNVETNIYRYFPYLSNTLLFAIQKPIRLLVVKTPWQGAQGLLHAIVAPSLVRVSGKYFSDLEETKPSELAFSANLANKLWNSSVAWCGIKESYKVAQDEFEAK